MGWSVMILVIRNHATRSKPMCYSPFMQKYYSNDVVEEISALVMPNNPINNVTSSEQITVS